MSQYLDSERRVYRSLVTGAAGSTCVTRNGMFLLFLNTKGQGWRFIALHFQLELITIIDRTALE